MAEDFVFKIKAVPDLSGFETALRSELKKIRVDFSVPASFGGYAGGKGKGGNSGMASMVHAERNATKALLNFSSAVTQATRGLSNFSSKVAPSARKAQTAGAVAAGEPGANLKDVLMSVPGIAQIAGIVGKAPSMAVSWSKGNIGLAETQQRAEAQLAQILANGMRNGKSYDSGTLGRLKAAASAEQGRSMYGDEAILGGVGELSSYVSNEETLKRMIPLLTDYAAGMTAGSAVDFRGMIDLATGLGKALDGTYDNLREKGFDTSELEELTEREKSGGEVTDDMKVAALERALADYKGLAQAMAETPMGVMEQLKNSIGDAREEAGFLMQEALLPTFQNLREMMPDIQAGIRGIGEALAQVVKIGGGIATSILPFITEIAEHSNVVFGLISAGVGVVVKAGYSLTGALGSMTAAINASAAAATKAAGANGVAAVTDKFSGLNSVLKSGLKGGLYGILAAEVLSITNALWEYKKQKDEEKRNKKESKEQSNTRQSLINTYKKYNEDGVWTDLELFKYKEVWDVAKKKVGVDMSGSEYDIWARLEREKAKNEGKKGDPPKIPKPIINISADFNSISRLVKENLTEILRSQLRVINEYQAVNV